MIIERNPVDGSYLCSDIVNGIWTHMRYLGYPKRVAQQLFRKHLKSLKSVEIKIERKGDEILCSSVIGGKSIGYRYYHLSEKEAKQQFVNFLKHYEFI